MKKSLRYLYYCILDCHHLTKNEYHLNEIKAFFNNGITPTPQHLPNPSFADLAAFYMCLQLKNNHTYFDTISECAAKSFGYEKNEFTLDKEIYLNKQKLYKCYWRNLSLFPNFTPIPEIKHFNLYDFQDLAIFLDMLEDTNHRLIIEEYGMVKLNFIDINIKAQNNYILAKKIFEHKWLISLITDIHST